MRSRFDTAWSGDRLLSGDIASIERRRRLEENDLDFFVCNRPVFNASRYNEKLSLTEFNPTVSKLHHEPPAVDEEEFILVFVKVPIERTLTLNEFHLLPVEVRGDPRRPVIAKRCECLNEVDLHWFILPLGVN